MSAFLAALVAMLCCFEMLAQGPQPPVLIHLGVGNRVLYTQSSLQNYSSESKGI